MPNKAVPRTPWRALVTFDVGPTTVMRVRPIGKMLGPVEAAHET